MYLSPKEGQEFLRLHGELLRYAAIQAGAADRKLTLDRFMDMPAEVKTSGRDRLYKDHELIDTYLTEESKALTEEKRETIEGFKHSVKGKFYLIKQYKKYAILMQENRLYGVLGITEPLVDTADLPVIIETVLLPFHGKIVCDGVVRPLPIGSGDDEKESILEEFKKLKGIHGIMESLPPQEAEVETAAAETAERELRHYLSKAGLRERYGKEIQQYLADFPHLQDLHDQLWSKSSVKAIKRELKAIGVRGRHYAVYRDSVVGVAPTRAELMEQLMDLSFDGKMGQCALFRL